MISPADKKAVGLLALLVLLTTVPFLKRAYFVDDFYFVTIARGILQHPLRPYDFRSDDAGIQTIGWERGQLPRMVNPLLFHYYLAAVIKLFGDASWKLRASTLLFSLVSVWSAYFLGKRFVSHPLAAASLLAITPAYWLTSYSLLIDSGLIAFFLFSLLLFFDGLDQRSVRKILWAGLFMGLTMLVKYVGALVIVLAFLWQLLEKSRRTWRPGYLCYFIAGAVMLLWGAWNIATYGQMHFLAALPRGFHSTSHAGLVLLGLFVVGFSWPTEKFAKKIPVDLLVLGAAAVWLTMGLAHSASLQGWVESFYLDKILVLGSFIGGCTAFLWIAPALLARLRSRAFLELIAVTVLLFVAFHSRVGGYSLGESLMLGFFIAAAAAFLILANSYLLTGYRPERIFLFGWIMIGIIELITVMPWTAGRYLLIILPPLCWAFQLIVESLSPKVWQGAWLLTALTGLSLAYSDYTQANTIKQLAHVLAAHSEELEKLSNHKEHHWYYLADTFDGSQPYLMPLGWENVFPFQTFQPGDLFLKSHYRKSSWWKMDHPERFKLIMTDSVDSVLPLRVMDVPASAGFYASCWGALPFAITNHPLERFELYQVVDLHPTLRQIPKDESSFHLRTPAMGARSPVLVVE
jgi:hypothetical protein